MQIEELLLYRAHGAPRSLKFRLGELNVITGDSRTGKSSLTNILHYCFGSTRPDVPVGPISRTVRWYGLVVRVADTSLFIGRPAPVGAAENSTAMLLVSPERAPDVGQLEANTTVDEVKEYLANLIGIEENLNVPAIGQTRRPLAANFRHSLYYCFQGQGEIANPAVLFHRQNEEWQTQTIRDTLPYFLGVQGLEQLRQRQQLTEQRRALRRAEQRLDRAKSESFDVHEREQSLVVEARDAGLLDSETTDELEPVGLRELLAQLVNSPLEDVASVDLSGQFERVREDLADQRRRAREIVEELQGLESFSQVAASYNDELSQHRARLVSIGLVPEGTHDVECPVCGTDITGADDDRQTVEGELAVVSRRLELAVRDQPRIEKARSQLLEERDAVLAQIAALQQTVAALVETNDLVSRERQRVNVQSYIRGKIAEYLANSDDLGEAEFADLERSVDGLRAGVALLEEALDPEALRSRVESAVARVNRDLMQIAQELALEHADEGVRLDPNRLTVVADGTDGPAYLDVGQIGSGLNWVGYHFAVYFALHRHFIANSRPVPRFVLLDQPSQAFFPADRMSGGDLDELDDTDRAHTKALYRLMYDEVQRHNGALQLIALDHADFDDDWFQDSVAHRWRDGEALIPAEWLVVETDSDASDEHGQTEPPAT